MKNGKEDIYRAAVIADAVKAASIETGKVPSPTRLVEMFPLDSPVEVVPDEIRPLESLPVQDGFRFIGWTADFVPVECRQDLVGQSLVINVNAPLVGWKPIKPNPLRERIALLYKDAKPYTIEQLREAGRGRVRLIPEEAQPYRGFPFCDTKHDGLPCADPCCHLRK